MGRLAAAVNEPVVRICAFFQAESSGADPDAAVIARGVNAGEEAGVAVVPADDQVGGLLTGELTGADLRGFGPALVRLGQLRFLADTVGVGVRVHRRGAVVPQDEQVVAERVRRIAARRDEAGPLPRIAVGES